MSLINNRYSPVTWPVSPVSHVTWPISPVSLLSEVLPVVLPVSPPTKVSIITTSLSWTKVSLHISLWLLFYTNYTILIFIYKIMPLILCPKCSVNLFLASKSVFYLYLNVWQYLYHYTDYLYDNIHCPCLVCHQSLQWPGSDWQDRGQDQSLATIERQYWS